MVRLDEGQPGAGILFFVACILVLWCAFMTVLSILGQWVVQIRYGSKPSRPQCITLPQCPGVSILRPLKGVDLDLEANLRSSFEQLYPKFELILSVASADDAVVPLVEKLQREYSHVDSRLIIGDHQAGINPKVNNLIESYRTAKYDIVWILDSNVIVDQETLGRSVDELLVPGIGLVHHLPMTSNPLSFAAEVEHAFLNTNHAKMYAAINAVGVASCVMGKSNLYRRSDLNRVGGLDAFAAYMAEDNVIGEALWHLGLRHRMSADIACQTLGTISLKQYCSRRARWVCLRKYIVTTATLIEPFTESIVCGILSAFGSQVLFGVPMKHFLLIFWTAWFFNDYFLYRALMGRCCSLRLSPTPQPLSLAEFFHAWLTRELLALPLYLYAMTGTEISWRGKRYRCVRGGSAVAIPEGFIPELMEDEGKVTKNS